LLEDVNDSPDIHENLLDPFESSPMNPGPA
jgi:hypothetical protein